MKSENKSKQIIAPNGKENKNSTKYPPRKTWQEYFHPKRRCGFTSQSCQHHQYKRNLLSSFPPFTTLEIVVSRKISEWEKGSLGERELSERVGVFKESHLRVSFPVLF